MMPTTTAVKVNWAYIASILIYSIILTMPTLYVFRYFSSKIEILNYIHYFYVFAIILMFIGLFWMPINFYISKKSSVGVFTQYIMVSLVTFLTGMLAFFLLDLFGLKLFETTAHQASFTLVFSGSMLLTSTAFYFTT